MKDKLIVSGILLLLIVFGMVFLVTGPMRAKDLSSGQAAVAVPFIPITSGDHAPITTRTNYLITNADELKLLWRMIDTDMPVPTVDFSKETVVAAFAGQQPTGGYTIAVSKVEDMTSARNFVMTIKKPGGSCIVTHAFTAPYQLVKISRTDLPLTHTDEETTVSCLQ